MLRQGDGDTQSVQVQRQLQPATIDVDTKLIKSAIAALWARNEASDAAAPKLLYQENPCNKTRADSVRANDFAKQPGGGPEVGRQRV